MNKKGMIWIIALLLLAVAIPNVHATDYTITKQAFWNYTTQTGGASVRDATGNAHNGTLTTAIIGKVPQCIFGAGVGCYNGTGTNTASSTTGANGIDETEMKDNWTFVTSYKPMNEVSYYTLFGDDEGGSNVALLIGTDFSGNNLRQTGLVYASANDATTQSCFPGKNTTQLGSWNWMAVTRTRGGNRYIWTNGTKGIFLAKNCTDSGGFSKTMADARIGNRATATQNTGIRGLMANTGIWSRAMNRSALEFIYNATKPNVNGTYPNFAGIIPSVTYNNVTLRARDLFNWTRISVKNLNTTIIRSKGGVKFNYQTASENITAYIKINDTRLYNITLRASDNGGYFNKQYYAVNFSINNTIISGMHQSEIKFGAWLKIANSSVSAGTINATIQQVTSPNIIFFRAGTYVVRFTKNKFYPWNNTFTITALSNRSYNITDVFDRKLNITVRAAQNGAVVNGSTVNLTFVNSSLTTNTYKKTVILGSTQSYIMLGLINGTYNVTVSKGSAYAPLNKQFFMNKWLTNQTFSLFTWNTFNFTFWDEITLLKLNHSNKLVLNSPSYNKSVNKNNSNIEIKLLTPNTYTAIYSSKGYPSRFRYVTLFNGSYNFIDLFLLNNSNSQTITITVQDQFQQPLEAKIVAALKYIEAENRYIIVESEKTNNNGITQFRLMTGNSQYVFRVLEDSTILFESNLSKIFSTSFTLTVPIGALNDIIGQEFDTWNLRTNLFNQSNVINLTWVSLSGTSGTICLRVTKTNVTATYNLSEQCKSTNSGSMRYNFSGQKGTISAVAYVKGSHIIVNAITLTLGATSQLFQSLGKDGLVLYIIMIIIAVAITITDIGAMPYALGAINLISWWFGIMGISWPWMFVWLIVCALFLFRIEER